MTLQLLLSLWQDEQNTCTYYSRIVIKCVDNSIVFNRWKGLNFLYITAKAQLTNRKLIFWLSDVLEHSPFRLSLYFCTCAWLYYIMFKFSTYFINRTEQNTNKNVLEIAEKKDNWKDNIYVGHTRAKIHVYKTHF